jgi:hypothetical protein
MNPRESRKMTAPSAKMAVRWALIVASLGLFSCSVVAATAVTVLPTLPSAVGIGGAVFSGRIEALSFSSPQVAAPAFSASLVTPELAAQIAVPAALPKALPPSAAAANGRATLGAVIQGAGSMQKAPEEFSRALFDSGRKTAGVRTEASLAVPSVPAPTGTRTRIGFVLNGAQPEIIVPQPLGERRRIGYVRRGAEPEIIESAPLGARIRIGFVHNGAEPELFAPAAPSDGKPIGYR